MATKSRATRGGEYVCKIGKFDIRHKITQPSKVKNLKCEITIKSGSLEASIYHGRKLYKGGFNDHVKAIKYAWEELKNDGKTHLVSKLLITKYKLS